MKLHLKFKPDADDEAIREVILQAEAAGASAVTPMFPGSTNPLLGRIYSVEVPDADKAKRLMADLGKASAVDYVEGEMRRSLR